MMLSRTAFVLGIGLSLAMAGCEQQRHMNDISRPPQIQKTAEWPELTALVRAEGTSRVCLERMQRSGRGGNLKALVNDSDFLARLKTFEETPIPPEFATPEREQAKKNFLDGYKKLQELSKSEKSKTADLIPQLFVVLELRDKITLIPGQAPVDDKKFAPDTSPSYPQAKPSGQKPRGSAID